MDRAFWASIAETRTIKKCRVADRRCAMLKHLTLVHRGLWGTVVLGRASSSTLRRRVCTELFPAHQANEALTAGAATTLGRTGEYWIQHEQQHSVPVATCQWPLSAHLPTICCNSQHVTIRMRKPVLRPSPCPVSAGRVGAAVTSRSR